MPPSGPVFNIGTVSGGLAVAAGSHSAAQSGTGHTANIDHREGADLAALVPLLQELGKEIGQLSSAEKRGELTAHVELAQHEAVKKDTPDVRVEKYGANFVAILQADGPASAGKDYAA